MSGDFVLLLKFVYTGLCRKRRPPWGLSQAGQDELVSDLDELDDSEDGSDDGEDERSKEEIRPAAQYRCFPSRRVAQTEDVRVRMMDLGNSSWDVGRGV